MLDTIITLFLLCWPFLIALPIAGGIVAAWQWLENNGYLGD